MAPRNRSSAGAPFVQVPEGCEELVVGLAAAAARMSSSGGGCMRAVQSIWMNTMGGSLVREVNMRW
jgi:hypothetical protein